MLTVEINANTHLLLASFALSCEDEEVAALLLGKVVDGTVQISRACLLPRKQKKKDRVEVGDQDLSRGMQLAESLGLVVVGWAHSHPHITIWPSHVDLKTQLQLQMLEKSFIGLIYGSFHENQAGSQRLQVIAFQAQDSASGIERVDIPLDVELRKNIASKSLASSPSFQKPGSSVSVKPIVEQSTGSSPQLLNKKESEMLVDLNFSFEGTKLDGPSLAEEKKLKEVMIKDANLIEIAKTYLQEELIGGEPKSGLEAMMSAARLAKIEASLVNPLKMR